MKPVNGVNARLVEEEYLIPVTGDGDEDEDSDVTQEGAEVSLGEDQETQGETASDEVNEEETPAPNNSEMLMKFQNDINRMKSTFQRKETELLKEKSVLEQKLDELLTSTMDEKGQQKYKLAKLQEQNKQLQEKLQQSERERAQIAQFTQWRDFFATSGVDMKKLDMQNGLEGLTSSGLAAMRDKIKALESGQQSVQKPAKSVKQAKQPPEVAQSTTGKVPTLGSLDDAIEHFAKGDSEKFWRMAETGNQSVLKVLDELSKI